MSILVFDLAGYSNYNIYTELTYDAASDSWLINNGDGPVPDDTSRSPARAGGASAFGFGDAEFVSTGLAVPWEERNLVLEISFGYIYSQDGPPSQGMNGARSTASADPAPEAVESGRTIVWRGAPDGNADPGPDHAGRNEP